jgi:hypothetical protein
VVASADLVDLAHAPSVRSCAQMDFARNLAENLRMFLLAVIAHVSAKAYVIQRLIDALVLLEQPFVPMAPAVLCQLNAILQLRSVNQSKHAETLVCLVGYINVVISDEITY